MAVSACGGDARRQKESDVQVAEFRLELREKLVLFPIWRLASK